MYNLFKIVDKKKTDDSIHLQGDNTDIPYESKELTPDFEFDKDCSLIINQYNDSNFVEENRKDDLIICFNDLDLSGYSKNVKKIVLPRANKVERVNNMIDNKLVNINHKMKKVMVFIYLMIGAGVVAAIVLLLKFNIL